MTQEGLFRLISSKRDLVGAFLFAFPLRLAFGGLMARYGKHSTTFVLEFVCIGRWRGQSGDEKRLLLLITVLWLLGDGCFWAQIGWLELHALPAGARNLSRHFFHEMRRLDTCFVDWEVEERYL